MKHIVKIIIVSLIIGLGLPLHVMAQPTELEMERAVLEYVETYHPAHIEEFKHMKLADPEQYEREVTEIWRRTEELKALKREHPGLYDLEIGQEQLEEKAYRLARAYQAAKNKTEELKIKEQLEKTVSEQFDAREKIKEYEVKQMEDELNEVKEKLSQRKTNKKMIVQQRVNQLLNINAGLGWE